MKDPVQSMMDKVWSDSLPALPYFIGILAFIFALQILEEKFSSKKRRWRLALG